MLLLPALVTGAAVKLKKCNKAAGDNQVSILANPQACGDQLEKACEQVFMVPPEFTNNDHKVDEKCYEQPNEPIAALCKARCGLCCEDPKYNCSDKAGAEACKSVANLCTNAALKPSLVQTCAATCGLCLEVPGALCPDTNKDCPLLEKALGCNNELMKTTCGTTCKVVCGTTTTTTIATTAAATITTTAPCRDNATDCATHRSKCFDSNPAVSAYVRRSCRRTCSLC